MGELSIAVGRSKNAGMCRSEAPIGGGALQRGGRHQGDPQPAVGGEALLRARSSRRRPRSGRRAGRRRRRWRRPARAPPRPSARGADDRRHHRGRGLVVRPGVDVHALLGHRRSAASPGRRRSPTARRATARRRRPAANLAENSPNVRCWLSSADQPVRRDVPERRRAAVAEHDLVALGQREQRRPDPRGPDRRGPRTGAWRCEVPISEVPVAASASRWLGWIFEGPAPKRPSAGRRSAGIVQGVVTAPSVCHRPHVCQPVE